MESTSPPTTPVSPPTVEPLDPAIAIGPHPRDPQRLLRWWSLRRAGFALFFIGLTVGILIAEFRHEHAEVVVDASSSGDLLEGLLSTFGLVFVAIASRLLVNFVALLHAYPVATLHQNDLGGGFGAARLEREYDRLCTARAFRELRWTDGVLTEAESRLGPAAPTYARVDRILRVLNAASVVVFVLAVLAFGFTIEV